MGPSKNNTPRGVLHRGPDRFTLNRYPPRSSLDEIVDSVWITRWELAGHPPHPVEVLPHPTVQIVIERDHSGVFGIGSSKFEKLLERNGRAVGIKFRPGVFAQCPPSEISSAGTPLDDVFGASGLRYERAVLATDDDQEIVGLAEAFVSTTCPPPDEEAKLAREIAESAIEDRSLTRVDDLARRHGLSVRALQRLFLRHVGVSPKWVLKRYRIHEAVERLEAGADVDLAALAAQLSYFDQAHFVRDFTSLVGRPPGRYLSDLSGRPSGTTRQSTIE